MASILLNTGTASYSELIANGRSYLIPRFQRDYSWEKEEWEDLWMDILELPTEKRHYMGYIVLQPQDEDGKTLLIIDGQQRFTTLSVFVLAGIRLLKEWVNLDIDKENNEKRIISLTQKFLGNFSSSKLTVTSKLFLNRNNDDFYQSYLMQHRKPLAISKLRPSQKRLWQAYEYYHERLKEKFLKNSGSDLASFIEDEVANALIFTTISVGDDLNAYKVFETLNARGVKLSPADLLKNYLFSKAFIGGEGDLDEAERRWQNINDTIGKLDLPTYIRHFWNSRNEIVRSTNLFRSIKRGVTNPTEVFNFLNDLENNATVYAAFENPADTIWTKEQRPFIKAINLFGVTQCYPLLLIAKEKFNEEEFNNLLHEITVITFRYNIISGQNPNEIERIFNSVSKKIFQNQITTARSASIEMKNIYIQDENFELAFYTKEINTKRNKNLVKYILIKIENGLTGKDHQYEDAISTIEHILPENPGSTWEANFPADEQEDYIYLIGNYTLLEESKNNKLDNNVDFKNKLDLYKTSQYVQSNKELNYTDWTPIILRQHQEKMGKWAKSFWKSKYIQS